MCNECIPNLDFTILPFKLLTLSGKQSIDVNESNETVHEN